MFVCIDTPAESGTKITEIGESVGVVTVMLETSDTMRKCKLAKILAEIDPTLR